MKHYEVVVTPDVFRKIELAFEFIYGQSPQNGVHWLEGIYEAIETLETFPARCGQIREQEAFDVEVRELRFHSHRIIFTIDEQAMKVEVHEFRHAAQDDWK